MKKSISLILLLAIIVGCFSFISYRSKYFASDLKVAILVPDVVDDNFIGPMVSDAAKQLKSQGITADIVECKGDNYRIRMTEAATSHEMVVCVGRYFWEIGDVSREYPSVKFVWMNNTVERPEDYPNLENVTFYENQGSYIAGYLAAAMTESGVIGIVVSENNSSAVRYAAGFIQGAKAVNSSIDVVTVLAGTGDLEGGRLPAMAAINRDADVLLEVGFGTSVGFFQAAKENDVYVIGTDTDKKLALPQYDDLILCSVRKNIGRAIVRVITRYDDYSQFSGGKNISVGMNDGYVEVTYGGDYSAQLVDENLVSQLVYLKDSIISQAITVDQTTRVIDKALVVSGYEETDDVEDTGSGTSGTGEDGGDEPLIVPDK